jgi:hypothetical protein
MIFLPHRKTTSIVEDHYIYYEFMYLKFMYVCMYILISSDPLCRQNLKFMVMYDLKLMFMHVCMNICMYVCMYAQYHSKMYDLCV